MAIREQTRRRVGALALATLGVLAIVWLVREAGTEALATSVDLLLPFIPLLLLFEGLRIALEGGATAAALGSHASSMPWLALLRAQLVSNSVVMSTPAGRPAGEAVKALLLAPHVGYGRGFAVGLVCQSLTLIVNGSFALGAALCIVLADRGPGAEPAEQASTFVVGLGLMGAVTLSLGLGAQVAARSAWLEQFAGRFPRGHAFVQRFSEASAELAVVPLRPLLLIGLSRVFQAGQFGLLLHVFGLGLEPQRALIAQGIYLLGAAAGDLVPAQLGVVDGAFAMGAALLATDAPTGIAIALALHLAQLVWVAFGAFAGMALPAGVESAPEGPDGAAAPAEAQSSGAGAAPGEGTTADGAESAGLNRARDPGP